MSVEACASYFLFKTRALDLVSCALLFPPRAENVALAERWARRAVQLLPNDAVRELGRALVERGKKGGRATPPPPVFEHSRGTADRPLGTNHGPFVVVLGKNRGADFET